MCVCVRVWYYCMYVSKRDWLEIGSRLVGSNGKLGIGKLGEWESGRVVSWMKMDENGIKWIKTV